MRPTGSTFPTSEDLKDIRFSDSSYGLGISQLYPRVKQKYFVHIFLREYESRFGKVYFY